MGFTLLLLVLSIFCGFLSTSFEWNTSLLVLPPSDHLSYAALAPATPRILLLTAHPDDECMFFAPTLLSLHSLASDLEVFSLCLSVGNADGLGKIRRRELERSLDVLGVEAGRRWIEDRPDLQDNFTARWDADIIADVLKPYVLQGKITTILTFDHLGISAHPNHMSLAQGAGHLIASLSATNTSAAVPRLFTLVSAPLLRKYTGPLAAIIAKARGFLFDTWGRINNFPHSGADSGTVQPPQIGSAADARTTSVFVSSVTEYTRALRAMTEHRSQLVWFRWLYVAFSRYMWVNEWVEVVAATAAAPVSMASPEG
ncbi:uncharacterized protein FIBRA_01228 [Fibroporia radiculosa]|uniref:N-acetylglucosaminylphosphatidylinositol deacetylase n=1 Tax=Fibroporia radiculosa TaxID=599839 RepID=J4G0V5_9APHY|nr:uncharacterized protein FIBRA_01228 [Fibroporia radiculosa]CCL99213.1 predicted protein [Fibroporia radiculosa]